MAENDLPEAQTMLFNQSPLPESPLCKYCRKAIDLWGSEKDRANAGDGRPSRGPPEALLLKSESSLQERVAIGCRLCAMVYDSLEDETGSFSGATFRRYSGRSEKMEDIPEAWGYIRTWRKGGPPDDKYRDTDLSIRRFYPSMSWNFSARLHRVDEKQCTDCSDGTPHDAKTPNTPPWSLVTGWLKECVDTHQDACNSGAPKFLPTRLLEVGTISEPRLRLRLQGEIEAKRPYLTLSHCWGPVVPKRLLMENLERFRSSIAMDGMSRTFKDAIYATRKLGVQYLWIDSLCIVQDSAADWQNESALMGQVYASGLCNLAATAATEGSQGLFLDKPPTPQALIEIDGSRDLWHLNENPGHHWGDILNFAPLNWRGWVFQERFLSTRVIHFGRGRIYWECGQKKCCDWPGKSIEREVSSNSWTNQSKSYWQTVLNGAGTVDKDKAAELWTSLVDHYSSHSAFTFVTDKLLAIGGLASRVQKSTQCRYLAGIWEHNLLPQLMWDTAGGSINAPPTSEYVAPSWSWASVHEPIHRYRINKVNYTPSPAVEILDIDIQLVTDNEFGQVKGGILSFVGRLGFFQDMHGFEDGGNNELRFAGLEFMMDRRGDSSEDDNGHRYLLVVEEQRVDGTFEGGGLVLKYVEGINSLGARMVFKRAGFFQFYLGKDEKDTIKEIQDAFDKTVLAAQLPLGRERSGKRQYVCRII